MTSTGGQSLSGKKIGITGAGSGIGAAMAHVFAREGAEVWVADRDEQAGQSVIASIQASGGNGHFVYLDVSQDSSCVEAVKETGPVDILVNNAGVGHVGTLLQTTPADLDRLYQVNVRGVFHLTQLYLPMMLEKKKGNIINLASIGGVVGIVDRVAYCTTKFAVVGMTKCIALDYAQQGIRCNCICPGRVHTPFVDARLAEYPDPEQAYRQMCSTQPLGRMARPEEIAAAAVYLASDESAFMTGTAFIIDGGFSAGK
jgi:2-keto-3-deoxy-L-fuconate dehydrogenase